MTQKPSRKRSAARGGNRTHTPAGAHRPAGARTHDGAQAPQGADTTSGPQTPKGWIPVEPPPERKKSFAALIALGVVLVAVLGLVAYNLLNPTKPLSVATLKTPAVGALDGGSELYPQNSKEAVREDVKFGYLPAVSIARTADGTLVLADENAKPAEIGLSAPVAKTDDKTFRKAKIPAPRDEERTGTTLTWSRALSEFGNTTVFMPAVTADTVDEVIAAAKRVGRLDGIIIRSADPAALAKATDASVAALYTGPLTGAAAQPAGVAAPMVAVPADAKNLDAWLKAKKTWVTGLSSAGELKDLAKRGAFGALSTNPFAVLPSEVKTD